MKSTGIDCGNINLRGKRTKLLGCQCCVASNPKEEVRKKEHKKEIKESVYEFSKTGTDS